MGISTTISLMILLFFIIYTKSANVGKKKNKVVLMSMDGFRYDYLKKTNMPHFDDLIKSGVKVPYVNNTFATWTFPSHYTIVTGRYEESHGIIANHMYDPKFNESFSFANKETKWWDGAEPVWINAVRSGIKTGVFFWPGSESVNGGLRPTEYKPYNESTPFKDRIDTVVSKWLAEKDYPFALIYFHEPDDTGHRYGPESNKMIETLKRMDSILGYFIAKLKEEKLWGKVDFILTSDHGMTSIDQDNKLIAIREHVNDTLLHSIVTDGALAHLRPQPGKDQQLVDAFSGVNHVQAFLKKDIPDRYFYKHHRRIMPVVLIAEFGWQIKESRTLTWKELGDHGYSNDEMDMKPIMIASGPSFKTGGVEVDPIKNVDIYPLLCHLLGIEPAPNNGSFERSKSFLRGGNGATTFSYSLFTLIVSMIGVFGLSR